MQKKITILSVILIIFLSIIIVQKEFQNDTFYLIKVGESIIKNGIDFTDHFSYHNLPYMYPHILFSLITYLTYNYFSFDGLYILTIILTVLLGSCMYYINIKNSKNIIISLAITLIFLLSMKGFITLRAQIVSYIILILEYYFLNRLLKTNKNKYIIYLFLLAILLVNTHVAIYPFYIIMFLPIIGEYIINKILKKENMKLKKVLITLVLSLLSGLISPLFINSYTYLFNTLTNTTTKYIVEHQPMVLLENPRTILMILLILILFINKNIKLEIKEKLLLLGLIFMTLNSIRHESLLIIFTLILFNKHWGNYLYEKENKENKKIEKIITSKKGILILTIYMLFIMISIYPRNIKQDYVNKDIYPVESVKYIKENLDYKNIRIFNEYNIGSYLILKDIKVFVDSRFDLYTKNYNKEKDILNDYFDVTYINVYYEEIFDKYNIDYVLLTKRSNLEILLANNSNYILEYSDKNFCLYKKR